jgi:hypothetical protein
MHWRAVLEHLLQSLGIGDQAARQMRIGVNFEIEVPILRLVAERTSDHVQQAGEEHFLGLHRDGSGLNLRQVQNIRDQV